MSAFYIRRPNYVVKNLDTAYLVPDGRHPRVALQLDGAVRAVRQLGQGRRQVGRQEAELICLQGRRGKKEQTIDS